MNATLIISYCVSMLYDHCICTYMSYLSLCALCSVNCKDASEENSVNDFMLDISLRSISVVNMNISLSMWRAVIGFFLSCNIGKCLLSGLRCYSISHLKFVLFFALLLLCHGDTKTNPGPKTSGNCQPLKFCHWNFNSILSENCF